jgi:hypothetical protein
VKDGNNSDDEWIRCLTLILVLWLSLCKIVRSSVILLLPLFSVNSDL